MKNSKTCSSNIMWTCPNLARLMSLQVLRVLHIRPLLAVELSVRRKFEIRGT